MREFTAPVALHDETLTLHLASPPAGATGSGPLILYASGDGGWFGAAVGMFRTIAATGRPTVGFSTKSFMHIEQQSVRPLTVADIVEDYQRIIATARESLHLPTETPVVITGWSRGASLGVLVASWHAFTSQLAGLVAIGLDASERLEVGAESDDDPVPGAPAAADERPSRSHAMYPLLARIAPRRSVVIQARATATSRRRTPARCSDRIPRQAAWSPSTPATTALAAASRRSPQRWSTR